MINPHRGSVTTLALPLPLKYIMTLGKCVCVWGGGNQFSSVTIDQYYMTPIIDAAADA